jgi:TP901 family phage tail tape measure protein
VQANFDAAITLDIGPFLTSIREAQSEVGKLSEQLDALNKKTVSPTVSVSSSGASGGSGSSARAADASKEIALQGQLEQAERQRFTASSSNYREQQKHYDTVSKRMDDQINQEARLRSVESERVKASMQERVVGSKNHATMSSQMDDRMAQEAKQRRDASNSIKAQMRDNAADAQQKERNLARERYALYDVAAAYTAVATAASAVFLGTARAAIDFEKSFSDVQRTTENFFTSAKIGEAARVAKNDLKSLASEIPVAFGEITEIATIGNQLGIAQGAIRSFTETVAKFSAATGVGVEQAAMSFGRIGELLNVPASQFENLGSSIAFAGVNAVATEAQILSVTKEIATTAKMAKFSTPDVVGLATALSSLGIAPEAARGSVIRTFAGINKAISENGERLQQYANIAGMPAEVFANTWKENGQVAFDAFLAGLQGLSNEGESLDTVLRGIGMVNVRDIQAIQKLGDNYSVYASSIEDANKGFEEGAFLADAYSVIQDTVAAKLTLVSNNMANLLDTIGQSAVSDTFKGLLDFINGVLVKLNQFAKTPIGQFFSAVAIGSATFIAVFAAINAVSALAQASLRAFATAQTALIGTSAGATTGIAAMNTQLGATAVAGNFAGLGINKAKVAAVAFNNFMKTVKWAAIIGLVITAVQQMAIAFSSAQQKAEALLGGFSGVQDALRADLDAYNTALTELGGDVEAAKEATGVIVELNTSFENNNEEVNKSIEAKNALNEVLGITSENQDLLSTAIDDTTFYIGENTRAWLINAIVQSEAFQKMSENVDAMKSISDAGFDMDTALRAAANGTLDEYLSGLKTEAVQTAGWFEQLVYFFYNLGPATQEATKNMGFLGQVLTFLANIVGWIGSFLPRVVNEFTKLFGVDLFPVSNSVDALGDAIQGSVNQFTLLGPAAKAAEEAIAKIGDDDGPKKLENDLDGVNKQLRTVVDYANDLRGIFSRAFEIRFGQQQSLDDIAKGWNRISDEAERAREAVADANAEINELTIDRSILEYQLGVAERYKDERRAASIRARLAKIDGSMAKATEKLADNTAKLSKETDGSSKEAIENRAAILGQLGAYTNLIEMYAKTGYKGEELEKKVDELKESFIEQALQAGYSREELEPYIKTFDDLREAIQKTPRRVDIEFNSNVSPATQAVNEYLAKINAANTKVTTTFTQTFEPDLAAIARADSLVGMLRQERAMILRAGRSTVSIDSQIQAAMNQLRLLRGYAKGGYVDGFGTSTSDSIPAMLSKGEYVIKASAVGAYGVDFMNALNEQKVGTFTSPGSGQQSSGGSSVIHLSPEDRSLLRAAIDRPVNLYTENSKIASSANAGNVTLAQRGAR